MGNVHHKKAIRSVLANIIFILRHAWEWDKGVFGYFIAYTIVTSILPFITILAPKLLIDELTGRGRVKVIMVILIVLFAVSSTINYSVTYLKAVYFPRMIQIRMKFINMVQYKCMVMDFKHTEDPEVLNNIETAWRALGSNTEGIEGVLHRLFGLLGAIISFIGYIAIVVTLNPLILVYLVANVLITYLFTTKVKKYEYEKKDEISEVTRKSNYIYDTMYNFSYGKDIRIYSLNNLLAGKFGKFRRERRDIQKGIKLRYLGVSLLDVFLLLIREGIIYSYLIYKVINNGLGIGNFSMYFTTIAGFADWMQRIMDDIAHIRLQNLYINDFRDFLDIDSNKSEETVQPIPENAPYEIEFKDVSFKYPNTERYIYKNLSLKIKAGQRLAIVGVNGAGKTTFVKLLTRLYEPTEGEILLNGINIASFNKEEYYKLFSVVFQEIRMFAFTVGENVALNDGKNINREKVMEAIEKSGMTDKVNSLAGGIDTSVLKVLDPNGIEFSGGENQRIALARALYKNGDVVILDEPTAALDPIAEYNIYKRFDELVGSKTAIYISHRLASTRFCDVIAFFEDGRIVEYGAHDELLYKNGKYAEMFNIQASYYRDEEDREEAV